ncbi:hypothetical protein SteCoe_11709 [Stentor coeruleus]|uniref:Uncharacterized protein n=1 Tax=Stentor coeruleus TaxID=5963 RepID=A0A1R2CCK9_9CILI|nr:hypothetical protein SteCoe_11709 [Stentor coeruleus]
MSILTTGKRFYNLSKNAESSSLNIQVPQPKQAINPSGEILIPKNPLNEPYIQELKKVLEKQENKIQELQNKLNSSQDIPQYTFRESQELINTSVFRPEISNHLYKEHYKNLDKQLEDKERSRIQDAITKEKEKKIRLKQLNSIRQNALYERNNYFKHTEEYRRDLEVQEKINYQIDEQKILDSELYQPLVKFKRADNLSRSLKFSESVPVISRNDVFPMTKSLNKLVVNFARLPAYQQPKFTRHSPKIVPSFPVIGSKNKIRDYYRTE